MVAVSQGRICRTQRQGRDHSHPFLRAGNRPPLEASALVISRRRRGTVELAMRKGLLSHLAVTVSAAVFLKVLESLVIGVRCVQIPLPFFGITLRQTIDFQRVGIEQAPQAVSVFVQVKQLVTQAA